MFLSSISLSERFLYTLFIISSSLSTLHSFNAASSSRSSLLVREADIATYIEMENVAVRHIIIASSIYYKFLQANQHSHQQSHPQGIFHFSVTEISLHISFSSGLFFLSFNMSLIIIAIH
jgi:hypothetical protein